MTPSTRLTRWAAVMLSTTVVLVAGGCGNDAATTSTSKSDKATTTEAPTDDSTTTKKATTTTPADGTDATTTTAGSDGSDATDVTGDTTWATSPVDYRDQIGKRFAYPCTPNGELSIVWGSGPYSDDSSVCSAGVHAGVITIEQGGRVVIEIKPGEPSYQGTEKNGVTTGDYGDWGGSFIVLG